MNKCEIEGYVSYCKIDTFPDGRYRYRFSLTLQAGKDRDGNYRKEYFDVRLSSELSQQFQFPNQDGNGCRVKVSGRIRNEPWVDKNTGQNKKSIYLEAFEGQIIAYSQFAQTPQAQMPRPQGQQQYQQPQAPIPQGQQQYQGQAPQAPRPPAPQQPQMPQAPRPPAPRPPAPPRAPQAPQPQYQYDDDIPF